jgi:hypothetical protein
VHHHINSVGTDNVGTEIPKKNRVTNLQVESSGCYRYKEDNSVQELSLETKYSIPAFNPFLPLDNKYESQEKNLDISLHMKYKNFKETWKGKTSYMYNHQATNNKEEEFIPTIMNGEICQNDNGNCELKYKDDIQDRINTMRKSIHESNSNNKHRVILVGDSHIRGYGGNLTSLLNKNYVIYSVVKPGSNSCELKVSAKKEIVYLIVYSSNML